MDVNRSDIDYIPTEMKRIHHSFLNNTQREIYNYVIIPIINPFGLILRNLPPFFPKSTNSKKG